jgi:hypothetical protein
MDLALDIDGNGRLVGHLREGAVETVVTAAQPQAAAAAVVAAIGEAAGAGYGECFWAESTGQYWWMFRRTDETVEVVVLWSSGAVTGWQHVFRATDAIGWVRQRLDDELQKLGLRA